MGKNCFSSLVLRLAIVFAWMASSQGWAGVISFGAKAIKSGGENVELKAGITTREIELREKAVEVDVSFTERTPPPYRVECFFIARNEVTKREWFYDVVFEESEKQFGKFVLESVTMRKKDLVTNRYPINFTDGTSGSLIVKNLRTSNKIIGWIARCTIDGRVERVGASANHWLEFANRSERELDRILHQFYPGLKSSRKPRGKMSSRDPEEKPASPPKSPTSVVEKKSEGSQWIVSAEYAGSEGFRTFRSEAGSDLEGRLLGYDSNRVFMERRGGQAAVIPLESFSEADRDFIRKWPVAPLQTREIRILGGIPFVWCPPTGREGFLMGSPEHEEGRKPAETLHRVVLTDGFWMSRTEVTQQQWLRWMSTSLEEQAKLAGGRREAGAGDEFPMYFVNWQEANRFCSVLSEALPLPSEWSVQLPSEAQWEYACRAGASTPFAFGPTLTPESANIKGAPPYGEAATQPGLGRTCEVATFPTNAWGLFDMHGNVWEWTRDWFDPAFYKDGQRDPLGPEGGDRWKTIRGAGWMDSAATARAARRYAMAPQQRTPNVGFRIVVTSR